jgi:hypothetical protein
MNMLPRTRFLDVLTLLTLRVRRVAVGGDCAGCGHSKDVILGAMCHDDWRMAFRQLSL